MNIKEINTDNLTIGDAKLLIEKANEVNALFGNSVIIPTTETAVSDLYKDAIGKYVIVRSRNEDFEPLHILQEKNNRDNHV